MVLYLEGVAMQRMCKFCGKKFEIADLLIPGHPNQGGLTCSGGQTPIIETELPDKDFWGPEDDDTAFEENFPPLPEEIASV